MQSAVKVNVIVNVNSAVMKHISTALCVLAATK